MVTTGNAALHSTTIALRSDVDLRDFVGGDHPLTWIQNGNGLIGHGQALRVELPAGVDCFAAAERLLVDLRTHAEVHDEVRQPGTGPVVFASFAFDPVNTTSVLIVPELIVGRTGSAAWFTRIWPADDREQSSSSDPSGIAHRPGPALNQASWTAAVTKVRTGIKQGTVRKVVLARSSEMTNVRHVAASDLVRRLSTRFPSCYTFSIDGLIGATPELLLSRRGQQVQSLVLAGSAPIDENWRPKRAGSQDLPHSLKNRHEHQLAVDSVVNVYHELCTNVQTDAEPSVLRLPNIQHLASSVRATLPTSRSTLDLIAHLHPTAAVCGTPRATALEMIQQHEGGLRGRYSGPTGWFDLTDNAEFGIALRCAQVSSERIRLFAGAGIVADSQPDAEYAETELKLDAMRSVLETP